MAPYACESQGILDAFYVVRIRVAHSTAQHSVRGTSVFRAIIYSIAMCLSSQRFRLITRCIQHSMRPVLNVQAVFADA